MRALPSLIAIPIVTLCICAPAGAAGAPAPTSARSASSFVDSVGVNVHMGFPDKAYANTAGVLARLRELRVRHVRDGILAGRPDEHRALAVLARAGVGLTLIAANPAPQAGPLSQRLPVAVRLRHSLDAVEGANEYDHAPRFAGPLSASQKELFSAARSALGPATPVLAPSLAFGGSIAELAALGPLPSDAVNIHPYPGGRPPDAVDLAVQVNRARSFASVAPVWATETGYHDGTTGSQPGVSERAAEAYVPRVLLHNYTQGIAKTFLYELADEGAPGDPDQEANFGLIRDDLSPKPSFYALKRLLAVLDDGGGTRTGSLAYSLTSSAPGLRQALLRRCDGSYQLAFWQAAIVYDIQSRSDVASPPGTVTLHLARPASGLTVRPTAAADSPLSFASARTTVTLPADSRVRVLTIPPSPAIGRSAHRGAAALRRTAGALATDLASRGAGCLTASRSGPFILSHSGAGLYRIVARVRGRVAATGVTRVRRGRPATVRLHPAGKSGARLLRTGARVVVTARVRSGGRDYVASRATRPLRP